MPKNTKNKKISSEDEVSSESYSDEDVSEPEGKNIKKKNVLNRSEKTSSQKNKKKISPNKKIAKTKNEPKTTEKKPASTAKKPSSTTNNKEEIPKKSKGDKENSAHFFLPGQKYPTPNDGDGTRAFYESLLEQRPDSKMAEKYCLEHGLLEKEKALEVLKTMGKTKKK